MLVVFHSFALVNGWFLFNLQGVKQLLQLWFDDIEFFGVYMAKLLILNLIKYQIYHFFQTVSFIKTDRGYILNWSFCLSLDFERINVLENQTLLYLNHGEKLKKNLIFPSKTSFNISFFISKKEGFICKGDCYILSFNWASGYCLNKLVCDFLKGQRLDFFVPINFSHSECFDDPWEQKKNQDYFFIKISVFLY